ARSPDSGSTVFLMILIWGLRARAKTIATGEFFSQSVGADGTYFLEQCRRCFTFLCIPLFPVGKVLGEQVKCSTCGTAFSPQVLTTPTSASFRENLRGALRVASMSMLAAGDPNSAAARSAAVDAARQTGAQSYDETWLA